MISSMISGGFFVTFLEINLSFCILFSYKNEKKRKKATNKSVVESTGQTFARLCCLLQSAVLPLILQPRSWSDVHFHTGQRVLCATHVVFTSL